MSRKKDILLKYLAVLLPWIRQLDCSKQLGNQVWSWWLPNSTAWLSLDRPKMDEKKGSTSFNSICYRRGIPMLCADCPSSCEHLPCRGLSWGPCCRCPWLVSSDRRACRRTLSYCRRLETAASFWLLSYRIEWHRSDRPILSVRYRDYYTPFENNQNNSRSTYFLTKVVYLSKCWVNSYTLLIIKDAFAEISKLKVNRTKQK